MSADEPFVLGLDIGTTRTKALLLDRSGGQNQLSVGPTPFNRQPSGVEMTVEELETSVAAVLAGLGELRREVVAVGVAGLAESGAPLDARGGSLGPIIAWHDPRGGEIVAKLTARFGRELAVWIGQPVRTVSSVAKLGWLIDQGVRGIGSWLGVPELCLRRLTGAHATEYSLAARTGCYHVGMRRYLPEVMTALGAAPAVFPPVVAAGARMGTISPSGAAWSGLPAGIPVTLAGHDHPVGMAGCGAGRDDVANSVGTAETLLTAVAQLPDADTAAAGRVAITVAPGGGGWVVLASAARAGIVLASAARVVGHPIPELDQLARGRPAVDARLLVAAIERGEVTARPGDDPGAVWNGVHAALAQRTWDAAGRIEAVVGPAERLVVFGGGSRSVPALRAKARLGRGRLWRSTADEAVARGAALYAGVAAGWWPSVDAGPRVVLEPVPGPDVTGS